MKQSPQLQTQPSQTTQPSPNPNNQFQSLNLFNPNQSQTINRTTPPMNNINTQLQSLSMTSPTNSNPYSYPYTSPTHNNPNSNANLRPNIQNLSHIQTDQNDSNNSAQPNTAAVLQDFNKRKPIGNGYNDHTIVHSPNSSINCSNNSMHQSHPNFDPKALGRRLRDQYPKKMLQWSEMSQNSALFERLDRPLVEALLLPKHRPQILEYEQKIIEFLISDDWAYRFPAHLSSFNRLLLHRLSETFHLDHHVEYVGNERMDQMIHRHIGNREDQNKAVTIYKMESTRFADIQLSQIDVAKLTDFHVQRLTQTEREEWQDKKNKYSMNFNPNYQPMITQNSFNNNHQNRDSVNGPNSRFRYQKNLKSGDDNSEAIQFDESVNEGQQPVRMLLNKKSDNTFNNANNRREIAYDNQGIVRGDNNHKNIENKVEKYNKMKEKIFSGLSSPKPDENESEEKCVPDSIAEDEIMSGQEGQPQNGIISIAPPMPEEPEMKRRAIPKSEPVQREGVNDNTSKDCVSESKDMISPSPQTHLQIQSHKHSDIPSAKAHNVNDSNAVMPNDNGGVKKKFGLKKGGGNGWAITKEKRTKDVNVNELFKKSRERLQRLCQSGPHKDDNVKKTLRASTLQKTLEEKRRNLNKLDAIYPKRWAGDNIDGSIKQDTNKFNTHSLIPNKNPKKETVTDDINTQTPPVVNGVLNNNSANNAPKVTDFNVGQHDRGATPLLSNVADTARMRNHPRNNVFQQGKTTGKCDEIVNAGGNANNGNNMVVNYGVPQPVTNRPVLGGTLQNPYSVQQTSVNGLQTQSVVTNPYALQAQTVTQNGQFTYANGLAQVNPYSNNVGLAQNNTVTIGGGVTQAQPTNLYEYYLQTQQNGNGVNNNGNNQMQTVGNNGNGHTQGNNVALNGVNTVTLAAQYQTLTAQKSQCLNAVQQYTQLIHYFQNAGALNAEQQTYLISLQQNMAIQQQHLQRIQMAEILLQQQLQQNRAVQDAQQQLQGERDKIQAQIEQHKALQLQLANAQNVAQNQSVQIAQSLQLHTSLYQQAQAGGNQNAMYVATLQMQNDQQLQQQNAVKLNQIVNQLLQVGQILNVLQQQFNAKNAQSVQQMTQGNNNGVTPQGQNVQQIGRAMTQTQNGNNGNINGNDKGVLYSFGPAQGQGNAQGSAQGNNGSGQQRVQQPNPTVNALILHTGNSAGNVNINIYADGQSGQKNQTNMGNNAEGQGQSHKFGQNNNHKNKKGKFQRNSGGFGAQSPSNSQENNSTAIPGKDGGSNDHPQLSLTNASSNHSSTSNTPNLDVTTLGASNGGVLDVAMGPRHTRQRPSPTNQSKFREDSNDNGKEANAQNAQSGNAQTNNTQKKNGGSNKQSPAQNNNNISGQSLSQQNSQNSLQRNSSNGNPSQNINNGNARPGFQSHNSNPRSNNAMNRGNNNQFRGNNSQNRNTQNTQNRNTQNTQNNAFNRRNNNRGSNWTPDVTVWMADWFYNRDQETKNTILQLQKRLRCAKKSKGVPPKRSPPNPPDIFNNDRNRYRSNSGRRGRSYHNRGRNNNNNYNGQNRGYNSRRDNNYGNNRFNNAQNTNSNSNTNNNGSNNESNGNQNNMGGNNGGNGNRSGYARNRRGYRHNTRNQNNNQFRGNNNQSNSNNNANVNSNVRGNGLLSQNMAPMSRNSNRPPQQGQVQRQSVSFASNIVQNSNANNSSVTTQ